MGAIKVTSSRKGAKSRIRGRKSRSTATKASTRGGRMRKPRADLEDEDFLERYTRAREAQADLFFKECLEIADRGRDSENESQARTQRDRLRVDTRKWMAARLAPKKYGDRESHDVQDNTTLNVQPAVLIRVESSAAPEAGSGGLLDGDGDIVRGSGGRR